MENIKDNVIVVNAEAFKTALEDLDHLSKLMDDMIVDMHNVKGGQQVRHSFMLYRKEIWEIKKTLEKGRK